MQVSRVISDIFWELGQGFDPRTDLVLSDATKVRLDLADRKIKLKLQADFRYPTDANLSARSHAISPAAMRRLLMMQCFGTFPEGTAVGFRIYDGMDELWWDGGAWVAAGVGEWNTEDEVNQNITTLSIAGSSFSVVLNLSTTDDRFTPEVELVRFLWEGPVDWHDDILIDSLVGMFQDELTYIGDAALPPLSAATASIDLNSYLTESTLNVAGVDAVYDDTNDPNHLVDLLSSFDSGTGVITLNSSIPIAGVPFIRLVIAPEVAWDTHQDFDEVGKLPAVVLRDTRTVRSSKFPSWAASGIVRKDNGEAWEVPAPIRMTFEVTAELRTDSSREQHRLQEAFLRLFDEGPAGAVGPFLRSVATDRRFRLWLVDEFTAQLPKENSADLRIHTAEFRIEDVAVQSRRAFQSYGVLSTKLGFNTIVSSEEQTALKNEEPVPTSALETIEIPGG